MRIVFMGTPVFATAILERLVKDGYDVVGVVSQPDKKVGRKQMITPTPVHAKADEFNIEVYQPISIKEGMSKIEEWNPDLIVTCAYGQMIPVSILEYPKYGSLNVHASLLPKLRGGAPIHKSIMYGEKETGVSIMRMVKKMDAGAYMLQKKITIGDDDTTEVLHDALMEIGADAISEAIPLLVDGKAVFVEQKDEEASFAYNISKEEEYIETNKTVDQVYRHIRSLISWPVGYIVVDDKKIKIHKALKGIEKVSKEVGSLFIQDKKLYLQCQDGCIELLEVQLEGKGKCSAKDFMNGSGRKFIK